MRDYDLKNMNVDFDSVWVFCKFSLLKTKLWFSLVL
jgi:hypothetical protein